MGGGFDFIFPFVNVCYHQSLIPDETTIQARMPILCVKVPGETAWIHQVCDVFLFIGKTFGYGVGCLFLA
jgi:hypothetical protein